MNLFKKLLIIIPFALSIGAAQAQAITVALPSLVTVKEQNQGQLLASHSMSLADRYPVPSVNSVFRDNILLTLAYMAGTVKDASQINWDTLHKSASYTMTLQPGEVFAFHDGVLADFAGKQIVTTNAHFNASEGFRSDGYLYGDGVCHFASLINWVARDAGLEVVAPTPHNFAKIPDIDSKYGTAIYDAPGETAANEAQNLYVENTFDQPVRLVFTYANDTMTVSIYK
jgi:VanW like protein